MVSDLIEEHAADWDVYLPAKVFSLCFKEHSKTKERPFSMLCCKGLEPVQCPRGLDVSVGFEHLNFDEPLFYTPYTVKWHVCSCLSVPQYVYSKIQESAFVVRWRFKVYLVSWVYFKLIFKSTWQYFNVGFYILLADLWSILVFSQGFFSKGESK